MKRLKAYDDDTELTKDTAIDFKYYYCDSRKIKYTDIPIGFDDKLCLVRDTGDKIDTVLFRDGLPFKKAAEKVDLYLEDHDVNTNDDTLDESYMFREDFKMNNVPKHLAGTDRPGRVFNDDPDEYGLTTNDYNLISEPDERELDNDYTNTLDIRAKNLAHKLYKKAHRIAHFDLLSDDYAKEYPSMVESVNGPHSKDTMDICEYCKAALDSEGLPLNVFTSYIVDRMDIDDELVCDWCDSPAEVGEEYFEVSFM